jgi:hypothetical protein
MMNLTDREGYEVSQRPSYKMRWMKSSNDCSGDLKLSGGKIYTSVDKILLGGYNPSI